MITELERIRYGIDDEMIQRLKEKAIRRSGAILLPVACHSWDEAITVHCGEVWLWYGTPLLGGQDNQTDEITTRIVREPLRL